MMRLQHLIDDLNIGTFNPVGLNILWPRNVAFLYVNLLFFVIRWGYRTDACLQLEIEYYVSDPASPKLQSLMCMNSECLLATGVYNIFETMCALKTEWANAGLLRICREITQVANHMTYLAPWSHSFAYSLPFNDDDLHTAH